MKINKEDWEKVKGEMENVIKQSAINLAINQNVLEFLNGEIEKCPTSKKTQVLKEK